VDAGRVPIAVLVGGHTRTVVVLSRGVSIRSRTGYPRCSVIIAGYSSSDTAGEHEGDKEGVNGFHVWSLVIVVVR
jgi:hypothetical protein